MSQHKLVFQEVKNEHSIYSVVCGEEAVGWAILNDRCNNANSSAIVMVGNQKPMVFKGYFEVLEAIIERLNPEWEAVAIFHDHEVRLAPTLEKSEETGKDIRLFKRCVYPFAKVTYDETRAYTSASTLGDVLVEYGPSFKAYASIRFNGKTILKVPFSLIGLVEALLNVEQHSLEEKAS